MEKLQVLLQRIRQPDVEIFVRDRRGDEWREYQPPRTYTNAEMLEIEKQRNHEPHELVWAKEELEKWSSIKQRVSPHDTERVSLCDECIQEASERLQKAMEHEEQRLNTIGQIWGHGP